MWPWALTYWAGNGTWYIIPSWVVFASNMNIIHEIGNEPKSGHGMQDRLDQGWGQFHFFNSIPIPIPLFSIPIPIPLLTIGFNSNSNSGDSTSNSGDFKSRKSQFQKWPVDVFIEIDYNHTNKVHVYNIIVINIISLTPFVGYINMASWLILYQ